MGIDGLLSVLKPEVQIGHISKFQGKTAAIDARLWLYKGAYCCSYELATKQPTNGYLTYVYKMLMSLKKWNIKPIMCIDGIPAMAKAKTIQARKAIKDSAREQAINLYNTGDTAGANKYFQKCMKITKKMIYKCVDMLIAMNIEYYIGPYEADAQIAYLCRKGYADFAITEDSDLLCYNCPQVVFKLNSNGPCEIVDLVELRKKRAEKVSLANDYLNTLLKLSEEDFTKICIVAGCDYLPSLKGMGIKKALKFFDRFPNIDMIVRRLRYEKSFRDAVPSQYEAMVTKIAMMFTYPIVYDPPSKKLVSLNDHPNIQELIIDNHYFIGDLFDQAEDVVLGKIHMKTFQPRVPEQFDLKSLFNFKSYDAKPTTQDLVTIAQRDIKNMEKRQQYHPPPSSQLKSSQDRSDRSDQEKPKIKISAPEEKEEEALNLEDMINLDLDAFYYPEDFDQNYYHSPGKSPSKYVEKEDEELEEKIDFLFTICKEYAEGIEANTKKNDKGDNSKKEDGMIEISTEKTPTKSTKESKPIITISQQLKTPTQTQQDDRYSFLSTIEPSIQEESEEDNFIDSFKKIKSVEKKKVMVPSSHTVTTLHSPNMTPVIVQSKPMLDPINKPPKRKFVDWDYTTSQKPTASLDMYKDFVGSPDNGMETKKRKENPSSSSKLDSSIKQPKINGFFSKKE